MRLRMRRHADGAGRGRRVAWGWCGSCATPCPPPRCLEPPRRQAILRRRQPAERPEDTRRSRAGTRDRESPARACHVPRSTPRPHVPRSTFGILSPRRPRNARIRTTHTTHTARIYIYIYIYIYMYVCMYIHTHTLHTTRICRRYKSDNTRIHTRYTRILSSRRPRNAFNNKECVSIHQDGRGMRPLSDHLQQTAATPPARHYALQPLPRPHSDHRLIQSAWGYTQ
jgi:hypothetical protein